MSSYRRPRHHTYDYNYKVGESSYRDMLDYLDKKEGRSAPSPPPGKKTFAERFAERPFYGEPRPLKLHQSDLLAPERRISERPSSERRATERPSTDRWASDGADRTAGLSPRPERRRVLDDMPLLPERTSKPAANEKDLEMDPEELIASIRRGRAKRMELLSSLEAESAAEGAEESSAARRRRAPRLDSEEPEEPLSSRLRSLALTDDKGQEGTVASRAAASSSSSYSLSTKRSVSSKMQSSSSKTTRSVHYD
ncbi:uncharacterized protein LOC122381714 [Amphibalanus amphitrite]|uniref:uncharacterized protein LOC122381714 n=1 Tax=Amphibalanus amphitrite TaxID=1232801 RepID=UPI001C91991C|nr:uncharacterized protein LOC122381714 [Amphibalanus amphitrite]